MCRKDSGYHGEWSPSGNSAAKKILGACDPSGFDLGSSLGTPFTMITPWLFHILSHSFYILLITSVIFCENIFRTPSLPNRKSWGADIFREGSPPTTCHSLLVKCHMSYVTCQYIHIILFLDAGDQPSDQRSGHLV